MTLIFDLEGYSYSIMLELENGFEKKTVLFTCCNDKLSYKQINWKFDALPDIRYKLIIQVLNYKKNLVCMDTRRTQLLKINFVVCS